MIMGAEVGVSPGESLFDADLTITAWGGGKLFTKTILPRSHRIRKVGGRDIKDYWVFGNNHPPVSTRHGDDYGEWRIEVEPTTPTLKNHFLHVLYSTERTVKTMPETGLIETSEGHMKGVIIRDPEKDYCLLFSEEDPGRPKTVRYTIESTRSGSHYIFNLSGTTALTDYEIVAAHGEKDMTVTITEVPEPGTGGQTGVRNASKSEHVLHFEVVPVRLAAETGGHDS